MPNQSDPDAGGRFASKRSRRQFVKAVGAAGIAGLAGCPGGGGGGADTTTAPDGDGDGMDGDGDGADGDGDGDTETPTAGDGDGDGDTETPTGTQEGEDATVEIAMPSDVTERADDFRQALYDAGLRQNVDVEFLSTSEISGDVQDQYQSWLNAGQSTPDIFRMDSGWTIPFIVRDQLVNLSERLSDDAQSTLDENYFEAPLSTARGPEGGLYGVPWQVGFPTIQYRKDLVEAAGFDPEGENWSTEPLTWQEFSDIVALAAEEGDVDYGFTWQGTDYEGLSCCTFNEFMTSWGGAYFGGSENLFGPVGDRPVTVNEEPVLQAIRMMRTFIHGHDPPETETEDQEVHTLEDYQQISPNAVLEWTEGPSLTPFLDGAAVATRYWPDAIFQASQAFEESDDLSADDLGTMPIPYAASEDEAEYEGTGGSSSALGGWHLTVNPNSDNVDAAVEVIEATMQESFRSFQFSELGYLTGDRRLFDPDNVGDIEPWGDHLDTLQVAGENAIPRPVTVVWPDQSPLISREVNAAIAEQKSPEEAMSTLESDLQDIEESV